MDRTPVTRRAALTGLGGAALFALSGCFLFEDDDDDDDDSSSSSKSKKSKKSNNSGGSSKKGKR